MTRPPQEHPPSDQASDDLQREYRRASGADDSRPSDRVRSAILEHAHRVAGKPATTTTSATATSSVSVPGIDIRAPAANDSRWSLRAVAGLAAVGLAGVLGVMLYRGNPDPQPVPAASLESAAPQLADKGTAPPPIAPMQAVPATETRAGSERRAAVEAESRPAAAPQADAGSPTSAEAARDRATAAPAPSAAAPSPEEASVALPSAAEPVAAGAARPGTGAVEAAGAGFAREQATLASDAAAPLVVPSVATVVGRYFAQALESEEAGQQYWVLLSRDGRVLRSGQRSAGDDADLVAFVESSFAGVRAGEVQRREFVNQRGRTLSIVYVYLAEGSPSP